MDLNSLLLESQANARALGGTVVAPLSGAAIELTGGLSESLQNVGEGTKQTLIKIGEGAGESSETALYGIAKGIKSIGEIGLGEGIGGGLKGIGEGAGAGVAALGTGVGKGVSNTAIGMIPAVLIFGAAILILGIAKGTAKGVSA